MCAYAHMYTCMYIHTYRQTDRKLTSFNFHSASMCTHTEIRVNHLIGYAEHLFHFLISHTLNLYECPN